MKVKQRFFLTLRDEPEREVSVAKYLEVSAEVWDGRLVAFSTAAATGRIKTEIEE